MTRKVFFFSMIILSVHLVLCVIIQNIKENPIKLKHKNELIVNAFPEGWAFFTKKIPKYRFSLYKIEKDSSFVKMQINNTTIDIANPL